MARPQILTLAFIRAHPAEAARVLERISGADAAALFESIPARNAAPVLTAMLPSAAARVLGRLADDTALALLTAAGIQGAVGVLRYIPEPRRGQLVERLPTATAAASRLLLGHGEETVGAWIDPELIELSPDTPVAEAMARARSAHEAQFEQLYVVDSEEHLIGVVELHELLRAPETVTLAALMHKPAAVLTSATSLAGAANQRGWERTSVLPVVDRAGRLIGVMRRGVLTRALARHRAPGYAAADVSLPGLLARGYWDALSGLAVALLSLLPRAGAVWREKQ